MNLTPAHKDPNGLYVERISTQPVRSDNVPPLKLILEALVDSDSETRTQTSHIEAATDGLAFENCMLLRMPRVVFTHHTPIRGNFGLARFHRITRIRTLTPKGLRLTHKLKEKMAKYMRKRAARLSLATFKSECNYIH